jgi:hypothetical protein
MTILDRLDRKVEVSVAVSARDPAREDGFAPAMVR